MSGLCGVGNVVDQEGSNQETYLSQVLREMQGRSNKEVICLHLLGRL